MDSTDVKPASAPYESDLSSEDEKYLSQNPSSSSVPHTIPAVDYARKPKASWSKADQELLISLRHDGTSYEDNAKRFTDRSPRACLQKYNIITDQSREKKMALDLKVRSSSCSASVKQVILGTKISDEFPERTKNAVRSKWDGMATPVDYEDDDDDDEVDSEWTALEDQQLQDFHRAGNHWMTIGQLISGQRRTASDCLIRLSRDPHFSTVPPAPTASASPCVGAGRDGTSWSGCATVVENDWGRRFASQFFTQP